MSEIFPLIFNTIVPLVVTAFFGIATAKLKQAIHMYEEGKEKVAKEAANAARDEIIEAVKSYATGEDDKLRTQIDDTQKTLIAIQKGLLSVQGRQFKKRCEELLEPDHQITTDEYEELIKDHGAYNGLGGNHLGDMLFESVSSKFNRQTIE